MQAVICGAGIAGLTLAWWLDHEGWDVLVVERAPALRDEGYMVDFFGPGYDVAELMGMLPLLKQLRYPIEEVTFVDRDGRRTGTLDSRLAAQALEGRLLSVMRGDLERALFDQVVDRVAVRFGVSVDAAEEMGRPVLVRLTDGTEIEADLLVGADGIHSRVRRLAFGPEEPFLRYLGYHTAAFVFTDPDLRDRLRSRFAMLTEPGRQVGFYALRDGRVATYMAHQRPEPDLPADPRATLRSAFGDLGWVVPDALEHCPEPPALYYDQVAQVELPCWHRGRTTLVGDACQAVSLLAGQGASVAVAGAYVLASELAAAPDGDVQEALARYEARLKPAILHKQAAGRLAARWVAPTKRWHIVARDAVLRLSKLTGSGRLFKGALSSADDDLVPRPASANR